MNKKNLTLLATGIVSGVIGMTLAFYVGRKSHKQEYIDAEETAKRMRELGNYIIATVDQTEGKES